MNDLSPFDGRGRIRADLDQVDVSGLTPERLERWNALIAAVRDGEAVEARAKQKQEALAAAAKARDDARAALPKIGFHDLWKNSVKGVPLPQ